MRLIDADALEISDISPAFVEVMGVSAEDIKEADTIEAIPVEWIESYLSDCAKGSIAYYSIKQMLYKWRKEREGE